MMNKQKAKRKRKKKSDINGHTNDESDDESARNMMNGDKSPFKTTYISPAEEMELKNTNNALYAQFNVARQSIYQQYVQKVDQIRHSNIISPEKRKLNIKIAAIDSKVQEKKLFLNYLEMSKPQPNSWMVSNSQMTLNSFARKINHQQQTPASYPNKEENNKEEENKDNKEEKEKKAASAKRVKKPKFSEYNVRVLRDWYETHTNNPYPSSSEKHLMCQLTGLTKYQVSRWFCNVRTRKPPPELSDNDEDVTSEQNKTINPYIPHPASYHAHTYHPYHPPMTPLNMPPMPPPPHTLCTPNNQFGFNPQGLNPTNNQQINHPQIGNNDEGLMPQINSKFNDTVPPPLLDEDEQDKKK